MTEKELNTHAEHCCINHCKYNEAECPVMSGECEPEYGCFDCDEKEHALELNFGETGRGFGKVTFKDRYGSPCSIQNSSLATERAIWIGIDDPEPRIMATDAIKLGMETTKNVGWVEYPIPKEVLLSTRMHLNLHQVKQLLPILEKFVKEGEI